MCDFKLGDLVSLKSDFLRMHVLEIVMGENGVAQITCSWRDHKTKENKYETHPSYVLRHWEDPNA